jgi:hypothetical protein
MQSKEHKEKPFLSFLLLNFFHSHFWKKVFLNISLQNF